MFDLPFDSHIDIDIIHHSTCTDIKFHCQDYFTTIRQGSKILTLPRNLIEHARGELECIGHLILPMLPRYCDRLGI